MSDLETPAGLKVAVVIPAYGAEARLEGVLRSIPAFVDHVVVVDDGSPDNTAAVAAKVAERDRRVTVVRHTANQGVGAAVLSGYHMACQLGSDIIVKMDSDGQMDPAYLLPLIGPIVRGEADYAKGNRFLHARQLRAMPLARRVGNIGLSFLIKLASGYWNVLDPANGYTAIHASLVPLLNEGAIDRRFFFESSMLLELGLLRAVVRDVPIPARYADEPSLLSEKTALLEFPPRLIRGFLRRLMIQHLLRDFGVLSVFLVSGVLLFLFGMIFGSYHWLRSIRLGVATATGTIMLAVLPVILGVQLLLQAAVLDVQSTPNRPLHLMYRGSSIGVAGEGNQDLRRV